MLLRERLAQKIPAWREAIKALRAEHGDAVIDQVHINQIFRGMRGLKVLVSDISYVDPYKGIHFRGYTIPEILAQLPKPKDGAMPYVGGLYWLLLTGDLPTEEEALSVEEAWKTHMNLPEWVKRTIESMPKDTHPMTLFSMAVLALQKESVFTKRYKEGLPRDQHWEAALEDALALTARLPVVAAFIYRYLYGDGTYIAPDPNLDWGANFAHMMGINDPRYYDLSRLYFILHSDHELGNASAHTAHLVGSTLSDLYYAFSAAMNALAGPLHGLANQNALKWLEAAYQRFGGVPTEEQLTQFAWDTLNAGQVIPGYGHAVLRATDPRYTAFYEFGEKYLPDDEYFRLVQIAYKVIPKVLQEHGKAANPWPNVDAISGVLQRHFGVEPTFYTVLFGIGRALGITSHGVWARAMMLPIERPKSLTVARLQQMVQEAATATA